MLPVLPTSHIVQQQQRLVDSTVSNQNSSLRESQSPPTQPSVNKRSSSMIFRIEHLLPTTATTAPTGSGSSVSPSPPATERHGAPQMPAKKSKFLRAGVHVTQLIPKDTQSVLIDTQSLITNANEVAQESLTRAYCSLTPQGNDLDISASIMRKIKLSEDIHSYNALFELKKGQVMLRIVRDVQRDEEIVAWFGEELTLMMAIPFLTPMNIQSNSRYMCHWCHLTFETPNPLKIHLALGCGRHNIDVLWIRLHYAIRAKHYTQQLLPLPLVSEASATRNSPVLPTTSSSASAPNVSPSYSPPAPQPSPPMPRFSAFKPISLAAPVTHSHHHHHHHQSQQQQQHPPTSLPVSLATALSVPTHHTSVPHMSFLPTLSTAAFPHMSLLQPSSSNPLNAAAQIEAIVSNMGASKQGHLCIYCGKMYSRKYGLKIHIRTHTGFKPLKCKYCLRPFGDPSNLNKHIRLHLQSNAGSATGGEVYQCTLCHKTFARRRDLQKHMENRHGDSSGANIEKMEPSHSD